MIDPDFREQLELAKPERVAPRGGIATSPSSIPPKEHWAIIFFDAKTADGSPVLGGLVMYEAFGDESVWRNHIELAHQDRRIFCAMAVRPARLQFTVTVAPFEARPR
jgi:hypothetical protein